MTAKFVVALALQLRQQIGTLFVQFVGFAHFATFGCCSPPPPAPSKR